ncbi:MAG: DUF4393 domain-containing protein [Pyrinomonadaceae bacterium]|nr:DUF4393 domain-containing protein [Pyrinomonadaceae bacterium]
MPNDNPVDEVARALGLKELAPQVYTDLLQPATQEVGRNLVTVARSISVALAPLEAAVWGYARIKEWLSAKLTTKLAGRNADDIQTPALVVAGPALLNVSFAANEPHLRDMYANLLATAMDKSVAGKALPSYVHILQQLSPDEARLLLDFPKNMEASGTVCMEIIGFQTNPQKRHNDQLPTIQRALHKRWCHPIRSVRGVPRQSCSPSYTRGI